MASGSGKAQRREQAREAARVARERQVRRQRLMRWLVPTIVTVVVLALAATVIVVALVASRGPAPQTAAGPRNMLSDGILLTGQNGAMVATRTPAIPASGEPTASPAGDSSVPHIVAYVDFACPSCKAFEQTYGTQLQSLVAQGKATLEVHPVAILDSKYPGSGTPGYSTRANNAGACVADNDPDEFYPVMLALYSAQATEGSIGLTDAQITDVVHASGLTDPAIDSCIAGGTFEPWLLSATQRAIANPALNSGGFHTPTVLVNGNEWDGQSDLLSFVQQHS